MHEPITTEVMASNTGFLLLKRLFFSKNRSFLVWQSPHARFSLCHFLSSSSCGDREWIYVRGVAQKTLYCTLPAEPVTQADVFPSTLLSLAKLYDGN